MRLLHKHHGLYNKGTTEEYTARTAQEHSMSPELEINWAAKQLDNVGKLALHLAGKLTVVH